MTDAGEAPVERVDPRDPATILLIGRAQLGDRTALDRLLRMIQTGLFDHIAFINRNPEAAKDVLQNVLFIVCSRLSQLRDPQLFRAWVFRIATREAIREARRARRRPDEPADEVPEDLPSPAEDPSEFEPEMLAAVPGLLADLPPGCGAVLRMVYLDQLSLREIAEALDLPIGTVKSRLAYGLSTLRERLPSIDIRANRR